MKRNLRVFFDVRRIALVGMALVFASCSTTPDPDPPELTPEGDSDVDLMIARLAKAVHVIADLNEDGEVTYQELLRVDADADDEKFREADLDNSGTLSLEEATKAITAGNAGEKLRRRFDPNGDGVISASKQAEFDQLLAATEGLRRFVEVEDVFGGDLDGQPDPNRVLPFTLPQPGRIPFILPHASGGG